jgi:hypothetical protein
MPPKAASDKPPTPASRQVRVMLPLVLTQALALA